MPIEVVTTRAQLERCWAIRLAVFVAEQKVPEGEEIDALDTADSTIHFLATTTEGHDLGTLRLLPEQPGHCHIGRVAVTGRARGTGVGRELMDAAASMARQRCADEHGHVRIELSAQEQAMGFYSACGYHVVDGTRYLDAGIWHQDMELDLS